MSKYYELIEIHKFDKNNSTMLKIEKRFWDKIVSGEKIYEVRRYNKKIYTSKRILFYNVETLKYLGSAELNALSVQNYFPSDIDLETFKWVKNHYNSFKCYLISEVRVAYEKN